MQSTNYWKNARQQGLPFTLDPRVTYRGYVSNCANMFSCTVWQFAVNGWCKQQLAEASGGKSSKLGAGGELGCAFVAGGTSALIGGPLELIMIQQQRKGGSLAQAAARITQGGLSQWARGLWPTAGREAVYTGGYLGVAPIVRNAIQERFPAWSEDQCRVGAAIAGGFFACYLSHPFDTAKTCMQGDLERKTYRDFLGTTRKLVDAGGVASLYRGAPWRLFRQVCAVFILDKVRVTLSPMLFPHRFQ